jgi:predicted transcriptional regulator YdeE
MCVVHCLYTEYKNGSKGYYTTIIGCKVESIQHLAEYLTGKKIPACTYRVYSSVGKIPDCVVKTWQNIWQENIHRKFLADFDVYGSKANDLNNVEVKTFLSVEW